MTGIERLHHFLGQLQGDIYPEPPSEPHVTITAQTIRFLLENRHIAPGERVLDVGCGQGGALELFARHGLPATGIALGPDVEICRQKGLDVREMDLSFFDFADGEFDFVWCRHALEHSVFPLFTLTEIRRLLREGGRVYVEVPAPDTACHHERNPNHYSVFGQSMWASLFAKAKFDIVLARDINFTVPAGPDTYWAFLLRPAGGGPG
jgi:SAM-dependent methyltransferase